VTNEGSFAEVGQVIAGMKLDSFLTPDKKLTNLYPAINCPTSINEPSNHRCGNNKYKNKTSLRWRGMKAVMARF